MRRLLVIVVYLEVWKSGVCDATPAHVNQDVNEGERDAVTTGEQGLKPLRTFHVHKYIQSCSYSLLP